MHLFPLRERHTMKKKAVRMVASGILILGNRPAMTSVITVKFALDVSDNPYDTIHYLLPR